MTNIIRSLTPLLNLVARWLLALPPSLLDLLGRYFDRDGTKFHNPLEDTILSAQKAPAGRPSVIPKAKYMTLGPKFYAKLVSAITRRRMNENQRFLGESSQNFT